MKKIILITLISFCLGRLEDRAEIIERYPSGEKKIIAVYIGDNVFDERLIKRYTFDKSGLIIKFEDMLNSENIYIKKPALLNAKYLKDFLEEGAWEAYVIDIPPEKFRLRYADFKNYEVTFFGKIDTHNIKHHSSMVSYADYGKLYVSGPIFDFDIISLNEFKFTTKRGAVYFKRIDEIPSSIYKKSTPLHNRFEGFDKLTDETSCTDNGGSWVAKDADLAPADGCNAPAYGDIVTQEDCEKAHGTWTYAAEDDATTEDVDEAIGFCTPWEPITK